jgi:hypothetical protein
MKFIIIIVISLCIVTPIINIFTAEGSLSLFGEAKCKAHFHTEDEGIIFAVQSEDEDYFNKKLFSIVDSESLIKDGIIKANELGLRLLYSNISFFYFSRNIWGDYNIKFYNKEVNVNIYLL